LLSLGLLLAAGVGMASWLFGRPFLTTAHGHVSLPLIGEFELASAMIFDLGVYVVVVTVVVTVLVRTRPAFRTCAHSQEAVS
jgi:multicomponent K+:H+ antiporter subunit A